ncbi:endonuclease/exonuclease/phosphatase family protein [Thioclava pacifica]|uniref:Endonuclease/exonuclease/phosphatase domain-containing protein n=1 Tax=Thioclava pacifica DSM 10166 TaxID=1353537 RepID=A0A074JES4_9RHOB|nr:endonuclease/exonuclease/phosphatase family protein [Thioclava pacifica]KEO54385.1 hypothetical protein TP2_05515 [Thioclava pacifica DSM 10166]
MSRSGPGLLLQDIGKDDPQIAAVRGIIAAISPDILLLTGIDWDFDGQALGALNLTLAEPYPYFYAPRPNNGMESGADLDGNGLLGEARDAQGYGRFPGQGGMALLSRRPILADEARDFTGLLWRDLPGTMIGKADISEDAQAVQRLSSSAHWDVPVEIGVGAQLHILAFAATPPVFDGPEDRNGWRNHDEAAFWLRYLDGDLPEPPPPQPFVLMGDFNLDPVDGEGQRAAFHALLASGHLQDPKPRSAGAALAVDADHMGDAALDTADFDGPGNLRVEYVLPSSDLTVAAAGVVWPPPNAPLADAAATASRQKLVWVDIVLP